MSENSFKPFTRHEALAIWSRLVAGWADSLDESGARTLMDGIPNGADRGGSYEGVTRMLWGLGSWLADPNRTPLVTWRGQTYDLEALTYRALVNGCDPDSPGYWGIGRQNPDGDQRTVETGQVAFAVWQTRDRIWTRMSEAERENVLAFLRQFGARPIRWTSNWALFWVLNHTGRKMLGADYDQTIFDEVLFAYMDGVYCGDGWYDDAPERGVNYFDDYNTWVFASHVMAWAQMDGDSLPARRDELFDRIRKWMENYPYFFAADGAYCEFGRSLAYKFSRLGAPLWAYKLGLWPHSVGMLKRLVGRHLRWYIDRGAIRPDGTLRQSLTATGSPEIIERYISTGATYWAIQAFGGLWALADDDPFWSAEEEPLPAEQGDFVKVFPQPGWIVTAHDGHVQRFNGGSVKPGYGAKYNKLVYSTRHPFNVGLNAGRESADSTICLGVNGVVTTRQHNLACAVDDSGWLRLKYVVIDQDGWQHDVDTILIPMGDIHIRAHRITPSAKSDHVSAQEGSAPLGYDAGALPVIQRINGWMFIAHAGRAVGLKPLRGYSASPYAYPGGANSVYGYNLVVTLHTPLVEKNRERVCAVYDGATDHIEKASALAVEQAGWESDGTFTLRLDGVDWSIPALPL